MSRYKRLRRRAHDREGGLCFYCNVCVDSFGDPFSRYAPTIDHIVPKSQGGQKRSMINVVLACYSCNNERGDMPAEEFLRMRYERR